MHTCTTTTHVFPVDRVGFEAGEGMGSIRVRLHVHCSFSIVYAHISSQHITWPYRRNTANRDPQVDVAGLPKLACVAFLCSFIFYCIDFLCRYSIRIHPFRSHCRQPAGSKLIRHPPPLLMLYTAPLSASPGRPRRVASMESGCAQGC